MDSHFGTISKPAHEATEPNGFDTAALTTLFRRRFVERTKPSVSCQNGTA